MLLGKSTMNGMDTTGVKDLEVNGCSAGLGDGRAAGDAN